MFLKIRTRPDSQLLPINCPEVLYLHNATVEIRVRKPKYNYRKNFRIMHTSKNSFWEEDPERISSHNNGNEAQ
jgi:hypothetical protein